MFLLGVDWPAAIDVLALSGAACLAASYVGYLAIDALGRLGVGPAAEKAPLKASPEPSATNQALH